MFREISFRQLILFVVVVFLASLQAKAVSCPRPSSASNTHLVVTIEGLGGRLLGSPAQSLAKNLQAGNGSANISFSNEGTWATGPDHIAKCVAEWKKANPNGKISIMGHSLGGGHANRVADEIGKLGFNVSNMIIFDGREGNELLCGKSAGAKYQKPANVERVANFYQCGWMPGNTYAEGPGVSNIHVSDIDGATHVSMVGHPEVRRRVEQILNGGEVDGSAFKGPFDMRGMGAPSPLGLGIPAALLAASQALKKKAKDEGGLSSKKKCKPKASKVDDGKEPTSDSDKAQVPDALKSKESSELPPIEVDEDHCEPGSEEQAIEGAKPWPGERIDDAGGVRRDSQQ